MEEKERFELFSEHCIKDNDINARCQLLDAYKACVVLNEQDKRIKELEEENLSLQEQSIRDNQNWIEETTQLKQQLAVTEKALELACEHIKEDLKCDDTENEIYNYFKTQAKEMLENE